MLFSHAAVVFEEQSDGVGVFGVFQGSSKQIVISFIILFFLMLHYQEMFDMPWKELRNQLTKLRQVLGQNINKTRSTKSGQSLDEVYKPTWRYWKELQFLVPCMNPQKSRDTLRQTTEVEVNEDGGNFEAAVESKPKKKESHTVVKEELM